MLEPLTPLPSSQVSTEAGPVFADSRTSFLLSPLPLGLPIQSTGTLVGTPQPRPSVHGHHIQLPSCHSRPCS